MTKIAQLLLAVVAVIGCQTQAALIQFENIDPKPGQYGSIPAGYGSIAEVDVSYQNLSFWPGYANLAAVAFPSSPGSIGVITLTPKPGQSVTLTGFDMASYYYDRPESVLSILIGPTVIRNYDGTTILNGVAKHFTPDVTSTEPIIIRFGTDWNNGINNIGFTATPVPEPSTWVAGGLTLVALVGPMVRRKR